MKRRIKYNLLFIVFVFCICFTAEARHLKGGWIQYQYLGAGTAPNTNKYKIIVRQYLDCGSSGNQIDPNIAIGIFDASTNALITTLTVTLGTDENITKKSFNPCLSNPPVVCYKIDTYTADVELAQNPNGYNLAVQRCCRIDNIVNVFNSGSVGVTYSAQIPGTINGIDYSHNNSPVFVQRDTAVVCFSSPFTFDFSATDADADSLVYTFCSGLDGGSTANPKPTVPDSPPYLDIPYAGPYSGDSPFGSGATVDPQTGIISGTAPPLTGDYVIAVCVSEFRNGVLISTTKKEIHITVANCQISAADLKPSYLSCDGFKLDFKNESTSSSVTKYLWDFGVTTITTDTSTLPQPSYTYADTGIYILKLVVTAKGGCLDSATSLVKVYPGYKAGIKPPIGNCFLHPYQFFDNTFAKYGYVDSSYWDFGVPGISTDTSTLRNPSYLFPSAGNYHVKMFVRSSKGCTDTASLNLVVKDKPPITLQFKDTLICSIDTLPLLSFAPNVTYSWVPNINISDNTIANPLVWPKDTTLYILTVNENGCINRDTITVNVLDFITVQLGADTSVCYTDSFLLKPVSHALSYKWSPSTGLNNPSIKYPLASPPLPYIKYYLKANLGKCPAEDSIGIFVYPYPKAKVNADTSVCFGQRVQLHGTVVGDAYTWTPTNTLFHETTLNPIAGPVKTTEYILSAFNTSGCLKVVRDTVTVNIIPQFKVFAGRDTVCVINQPLQLFVSVADTTNKTYLWTPSTALNHTNIANPIAVFNSFTDSITYIVKVSTPEGCFATDTVKVKVYRPIPDIYVPTAFTPNNDGLNDVLKPIPVGVSSLQYFNVYNRWGQLVFTTNEFGKGWDGTINGQAQASGTFVFTVQGTDYLGKTIYKKGTSVLIR